MHAIRRLIARLAAAAVLLVPLLAVPAPATALCAEVNPNPMLTDDPQGVVFVGTAVEARANDYSALFHVTEVWMGGPLPEWQPVYSLFPETDNLWVEDEAQWQAGTEYLVVTHRRGGMLIGASECTGGNRPYSAALAAYRPDTVSSPLPAGRPLFWAWRQTLAQHWGLFLMLGALLVVLAAGWVVWLWRRPGRDGRSRAS